MIDNLENIGKAAQSVGNSDNFDRSGASECFLTRFDKCLQILVMSTNLL